MITIRVNQRMECSLTNIGGLTFTRLMPDPPLRYASGGPSKPSVDPALLQRDIRIQILDGCQDDNNLRSLKQR